MIGDPHQRNRRSRFLGGDADPGSEIELMAFRVRQTMKQFDEIFNPKKGQDDDETETD